MKSRVSPVHIWVLIIGIVCICIIFVLALFYSIRIDQYYREIDLKYGFWGGAILSTILFIDIKVTARKIFFIVEMSDEGITERFIRITQQLKWSEIKYIYIVDQPYIRSTWLCFSKVHLTKKDFLRVLSSHKSIVFPLTKESKKFVSERCDIKIVSMLD